MSADDVRCLLDRLAAGDMDAAGELFRALEPYLRVLVRRQLDAPLRAKFDSLDIVQSVFADLVKGFREKAWQFDDPMRFRAFVVTMARNRFLDHFRHHRPEVQ